MRCVRPGAHLVQTAPVAAERLVQETGAGELLEVDDAVSEPRRCVCCPLCLVSMGYDAEWNVVERERRLGGDLEPRR